MNEKYINREEALRYIGHGSKPEGELLVRLEECERQIASAAIPRYVYKVFEKSELEGLLTGKDIQGHLSDCDRVILFAATLGVGVDRYINKCQITDIASAMIADAVAGAFIEEYCKEADRVIASEMAPLHITWRFGVGYGDFSVEQQGRLLELLDAKRRIGLYTTESSMLVPVKSVTAVIGVSDGEIKKENLNCALCSMRDRCAFRKEGEHCGCQSAS